MEKNSKNIGLACGVIALVIAVATALYMWSVSSGYTKALDDYKLSNSIKVYATPENAQTPESAQGSEDADSHSHFNSLNIYESSGYLKVKDSTLTLTSDDGQKVKFDATIKDAEGNSELFTVQYSDKLDGCVIAGVINVTLAEDQSGYGTGRFLAEDGSEIVTGRRKLSDNLCIQANAVSNDEYSGERLQEVIEYIVNSAEIIDDSDTTSSIVVCGMTIKDPDNVDIRMSKDILEIKHMSEEGTEESIYISPYNESLTGAGLDKSLEIGENTLKYGSLKDSVSGYTPFVLKSDNGNIKVSVIASEVINNLFN